MGILFALLTAFGFAISNIFVRKGMEKSKGDNGFLITVIINVLILGIAALIYRLVVTNVPITMYGFLLFAISGVFTTFLGRMTLFMSYREIGPSRGAAIKNSAPLFTVLFAVLFLNEWIGLLPSIGTFFVLAGLGIQGFFLIRQTTTTTANDQSNLKKGYFLALFSAMVFGTGQAIRKPGLEELPDPFFGAFAGALTALILVLLSDWSKGVLKTNLRNQITSFNLFYLWSGLFTSIAMLSFFIGVTYIQVSYVAAIAAMEPLLTILLSKLFLRKQETIARYTIFSSLIVFTGVIIIILFT
ncbi:DMT family transporter [Desertibacillus haloalkaliphilus]|uniref:DMT family transporter n=1 Tax=Desertibacillus haloalkaliphilus TaxID=1328930 RepID=UPI001C25443B|nr:EamA family transporter [Desertibacillus haloalkaliphilus]MBU8906793.1 DMT family transporter [Desertibacillus haloalkaliphilus]